MANKTERGVKIGEEGGVRKEVKEGGEEGGKLGKGKRNREKGVRQG